MLECVYKAPRKKKWVEGYIKTDAKRVFLYDNMKTQLDYTFKSSLKIENSTFSINYYSVLCEEVEDIMKQNRIEKDTLSEDKIEEKEMEEEKKMEKEKEMEEEKTPNSFYEKTKSSFKKSSDLFDLF